MYLYNSLNVATVLKFLLPLFSLKMRCCIWPSIKGQISKVIWYSFHYVCMLIQTMTTRNLVLKWLYKAITALVSLTLNKVKPYFSFNRHTSSFPFVALISTVFFFLPLHFRVLCWIGVDVVKEVQRPNPDVSEEETSVQDQTERTPLLSWDTWTTKMLRHLTC